MVMTYNAVLLILLVVLFLWPSIRKTKRRKQICAVLLILLLGLVSGFRFQNEASDFMVNYLNAAGTKNMTWASLFSKKEFLHLVLRKIVMLVFDDPQWYFILTGLFVSASAVIFSYKYSPNMAESVFLFFAVGIYFFANNGTRQGIAVSICLFSIPFILKKALLPFVMVLVIACLFHTSALVFFPLYFLANLHIGKKICIAYIGMSVLIVLMLPKLVGLLQRYGIYDNYVEDAYGLSQSNILHIVLPIIFVVFSQLTYTKKESQIVNKLLITLEGTAEWRLNNLLAHTSWLYFICVLASVSNMLNMSRVSMYFNFCILLLPHLIKRLNSEWYRIVRCAILVYAAAYFLIFNYLGKLCPTPYTPFWTIG